MPLNAVLKKKPLSSLRRAARCTPKLKAEGIEPTGMRRDGRASPRGREGRAEFESMVEKKKEWSRAGMRRHRRASPRGRECGQRLSQFIEKGAEVYVNGWRTACPPRAGVSRS